MIFRAGTIVFCVQNLDYSGANKVIFNIITGPIHSSNIVVLSPKAGPFASRFNEGGAAVRVGNITSLLNNIRDIVCIICNTIMTADIICKLEGGLIPTIWIIHEWWDDEAIRDNLRIRNLHQFTIEIIKKAFHLASRVVFMCEAQRKFYGCYTNSVVILPGVADFDNHIRDESFDKQDKVFTLLCLGIVCPRKNQCWTVEIFQKFAQNKKNVRLQIVGARETRKYEIEYLQQLRTLATENLNIEIYDVTDDVESFFLKADCLILTSLNEVTPMVIPEAMAFSLPILSTDIAGIKEMVTDGVEGFLFNPGDITKAVASMELIYHDQSLRDGMGIMSRKRFDEVFHIKKMTKCYRELIASLCPPVILVDMDGVLVDWDAGFQQQWKHRSPIERSLSYKMEECVPIEFKQEAIQLIHSQGFFEMLPPMAGGIDAVKAMIEYPYHLDVRLCTSPILTSEHCVQEKMNWIRSYLGPEWLVRTIFTTNKHAIVGNVLIDDKPMPFDLLMEGSITNGAPWKQIVFNAPYNQHLKSSLGYQRLNDWTSWKSIFKTQHLLMKNTSESDLFGDLQMSSSNFSLSDDVFLNDDDTQVEGHEELVTLFPPPPRLYWTESEGFTDYRHTSSATAESGSNEVKVDHPPCPHHGTYDRKYLKELSAQKYLLKTSQPAASVEVAKKVSEDEEKEVLIHDEKKEGGQNQHPSTEVNYMKLCKFEQMVMKCGQMETDEETENKNQFRAAYRNWRVQPKEMK